MEEEGNVKGEEAFRKTRVPPWTKQITVRSVVTSFVLSLVFNFIVCKLNFTTGIIPSLNVAAGLLGFAVIKSYTTLLNRCGFLKQPFTRQENTVIQTFVVASSGIAFSSELFLIVCSIDHPFGHIFCTTLCLLFKSHEKLLMVTFSMKANICSHDQHAKKLFLLHFSFRVAD